MRYGIYDRKGRMICHTLDEAIHRMVHRMADDGRVRVLMLFDRREFMHELASMVWVEADNVVEATEVTKATDASTHHYKEIAEDENWPMVCRWIELAVVEIEQMLYSLTKVHEQWHRSMDNRVSDAPEWAIEMRVKPDVSETSINLLMSLANEYMKARALMEWAGLVFMEKQPYWEKKAEQLKEQIRDAGRSCEILHHVKRPMWPAW